MTISKSKIEKESIQEKVEEGSKKQKYIYFEVMRIIAVFLAIFNHTQYDGYFLFAKQEVGSLKFWIYLFMSIACKVAVPIFFAISGALVLGKEESLKTLWKKRISRMIIILFLISVLYYLQIINWDMSRFSINNFFGSLYSGTIEIPLWFLYVYISYLICLPLLRAIVKNFKDYDYYYLIAVVLFFNAFIPIMEYLIWNGRYTISAYMEVSWVTSNVIIYPCIGYFLQHKFKQYNDKKTIIFFWVANIITILISCYMTYYKGRVTGVINEDVSQTFHSSFALINCMCVFITVKYIFEKFKMPNWINKLIYSIGSCVLGIYLFHIILLNNKYMKNFLIKIKDVGINDMVAILIWCSCIVIIVYIVTLLLKKIPGINKLI